MDDLFKFTNSIQPQQLNLLHANENSSSTSTLSSTVSSTSSSSQINTFETNLQCSHNFWVKMSECDEQFIGPKRSKHTMVAYNNSLYVFGGDNGKQMLNDLICYDSVSNVWSKALNLSPPTPRYHHTAVVYNNSMFVFGGYTGDLNSNSNLCNKNDLYEYRFSTGTWLLWNSEESAKPVPRAAHGAVVYDNKLWIFAGYDGNFRLNDMWSISLNTPQNSNKIWTVVEQTGDLPSTVCNFSLAVIHDSMYLFSGQSGAKTSNLLFKFDFKTSCWSKISSNFILRGTQYPPERRSGHNMVVYDNHLYIYGGVLGNSFFHDVYSFDLETKTWDLIQLHHSSPLPTGRSFLASAVLNENLYVFGGNGDQNTRSNELYKLKLPNQPKSTLKDDFYKLFKKELFCDLKFICADNFVLAHCAIVASRSCYCRQLIKIAKEKLNQIQDSKPPFIIDAETFVEIKLNEENSSTLKVVLEFLYTDRIISLEGKEHEFETVKLMIDVYKIANQFQVPKLKKICENFIESSLTCSNVLSVLRYVDSSNLNTLKEFCMKFLAKDQNFNLVIMLTEFETLQSALMVEIIRLRQTPRKSTNNDQMNDLISSKCTTLTQDLENFILKDIGDEFADILIILNDNSQPLLAHKCILASRCAYFEAYFRSFMPKERKVLLTIGDTIPPRQACISLLKYIYYDDVSMPPQDALYLFSASHYFQFSNLRLHVFCKQNLEINVSKNNVFDILEAADKIKDDNMKNFALKIVANNYKELVNSNRIRKLSKELLIDIMKYVARNINLNLNGSASLSSASALTTLKFNSISNNSFQHQSLPMNVSCKEELFNQK